MLSIRIPPSGGIRILVAIGIPAAAGASESSAVVTRSSRVVVVVGTMVVARICSWTRVVLLGVVVRMRGVGVSVRSPRSPRIVAAAVVGACGGVVVAAVVSRRTTAVSLAAAAAAAISLAVSFPRGTRRGSIIVPCAATAAAAAAAAAANHAKCRGSKTLAAIASAGTPIGSEAFGACRVPSLVDAVFHDCVYMRVAKSALALGALVAAIVATNTIRRKPTVIITTSGLIRLLTACGTRLALLSSVAITSRLA
jgi:hypothetical protein